MDQPGVPARRDFHRADVPAMLCFVSPAEILFIVQDAPEGGYVAKAVGESIVTEADDLAQLHERVRDAVRCHFEKDAAPRAVRLHFVRDEVFAV